MALDSAASDERQNSTSRAGATDRVCVLSRKRIASTNSAILTRSTGSSHSHAKQRSAETSSWSDTIQVEHSDQRLARTVPIASEASPTPLPFDTNDVQSLERSTEEGQLQSRKLGSQLRRRLTVETQTCHLGPRHARRPPLKDGNIPSPSHGTQRFSNNMNKRHSYHGNQTTTSAQSSYVCGTKEFPPESRATCRQPYGRLLGHANQKPVSKERPQKPWHHEHAPSSPVENSGKRKLRGSQLTSISTAQKLAEPRSPHLSDASKLQPKEHTSHISPREFVAETCQPRPPLRLWRLPSWQMFCNTRTRLSTVTFLKKSAETCHLIWSTAKSVIRHIRTWSTVDRILQCRITLLTVYFGFHYIFLSLGVWERLLFVVPPPPPLLAPSPITSFGHPCAVGACNTTTDNNTFGFLNPEELLFRKKVERFINLIHPHVDGHPHLHQPLSKAMRTCLGLVVVELTVLLWMTTALVRKQRSARLFGLFSAITLFMNITATWYGGLDAKAVLFPNLWGYIDGRLQVSLFYPNAPDVRLKLPLLQQRWFPILNPRPYFSNTNRRLGAEMLLLSEDTTYPSDTLLAPVILPAIYVVYIMDFLGTALCVFSTCAFLNPFDLVIPTSLLCLALGIGAKYLTGIPAPNAGDNHWIDFSLYKNKLYNLPNLRTPPIRITQYIPMADGVELAADIYLPHATIQRMVNNIPDSEYKKTYSQLFGLRKNANKEAQLTASQLLDTITLPTFIHVTRYNRRMTVRWPFTLLSLWGQPRGSSTTNVWGWQFVDTLTPNGYVVVCVDTRGTGASFGSRIIDLSPVESLDLQFIRNWVGQQFWFNGKVAAGGFSYDGMTGLYLAAAAKGSAQVALALFTPINVVHDLLQPGGLVCSAFVEEYTRLTRAFELDGTPRKHMLFDFGYSWYLTVGFLLTFDIAAPVKGREASLLKAIAEHRNNWNMSQMVETFHFSDDFVVLPTSGNSTSAQRIPVNHFGVTYPMVEKIIAHNVSVYIVGGYCDSSSVRGSVRLYESLRFGKQQSLRKHNRHHKLILGPWSHTGRQNCSPYARGVHPHFELDMYWDVLRFLDLHLKNKVWDAHLQKEPRVHYWVVGDEKWASADTFPPTKVKKTDFFLDDRIQLSKIQPTTRVAFPLSSKKSTWRKGLSWIQNLELPSLTLNLYLKRDPKEGLVLPRSVADKTSWDELETIGARAPSRLKSSEQLTGQTPRGTTVSYTLLKSNSDSSPSSKARGSGEIQPSGLVQKRFIQYAVDYNASTTGLSRWAIARHPFRATVSSPRQVWPTRRPTANDHQRPMLRITLGDFFNLPLWSSSGSATGTLLLFSTPPLKQDVLLVGSPLLRFPLNLTDEFAARDAEVRRNFREKRTAIRVNELDPVPVLDITVFGYLEDFDPTPKRKGGEGTAHYVTEGRSLLSHRPSVPDARRSAGMNQWKGCAQPPATPDKEDFITLRQRPRIGSADIIYQSGSRKVHRFSVGGVECIAFTFEPVSWAFKAGHSIRLSLAGADKANFLWARTQSKEDADLLAQSLLSAAKEGNDERLKEIQKHPVRVERPRQWVIPLHDKDNVAFLQLPVMAPQE